MFLSFVDGKISKTIRLNLRGSSYCTPIDSKNTYFCLIILEKLPTFWTFVAWSNKQIDFFSRFLFCCDISLIFLSISVCLLIAVFRSLQQSHSFTVVFCDKAVPQTGLSHRARKNKSCKIPFKIWLAILRVTSYSLKWILNVIQDIFVQLTVHNW